MTRKTRLYTKRGRFYGDFRDLGGGLEALKPKGERIATTDPDVAAKIASDRVTELEAAKKDRDSGAKARALGIERPKGAGLKWYAALHLNQKEEDEEVVASWLKQTERHLQTAVDYFGAATEIASLTPLDMGGFVKHLRGLSNKRGGTLSDTTVRKHLNSLSNLYRRGVSDGYVTVNPVADMYSKPTENKVEADFLSAKEAAVLLEAARTYRAPVEPERQDHGGAISAKPNPHLYPILATFLLTGARKSEVLGLEVDDVSLRLGRIFIRSNKWRRLKTKGSTREVPLWPQLRTILEAYFLERAQDGATGDLLFPSNRGQTEGMIRDLRKALDKIGERAGFPAGHVRLHMLRHTYTAARIQTLDRGAPVSLYTVARELGHSSQSMIEERYGHLHGRAVDGGSAEVEFRIEHHRESADATLEEATVGAR
ncbi:MAG: site-specific integrase [Gemmatimonadota bacterium]